MSRLIWIFAVCKSLLLSPVAVKELKLYYSLKYMSFEQIILSCHTDIFLSSFLFFYFSLFTFLFFLLFFTIFRFFFNFKPIFFSDQLHWHVLFFFTYFSLISIKVTVILKSVNPSGSSYIAASLEYILGGQVFLVPLWN